MWALPSGHVCGMGVPFLCPRELGWVLAVPVPHRSGVVVFLPRAG